MQIHCILISLYLFFLISAENFPITVNINLESFLFNSYILKAKTKNSYIFLLLFAVNVLYIENMIVNSKRYSLIGQVLDHQFKFYKSQNY